MNTLFPKRNLCESQHTIGSSQTGHHALQPVVGEHRHNTQCAKRKRRGQSEMSSAIARWNLTNSSEHVTHTHVLPGNSCTVVNFIPRLINPLGAKCHSESTSENFQVIFCTVTIEVMNNIFLLILIRSNEMQQYAGVYLLQNYSTCFGCLSHPSSGVHQTVTAASDIGHSVGATTFLQRGR